MTDSEVDFVCHDDFELSSTTECCSFSRKQIRLDSNIRKLEPVGF